MHTQTTSNNPSWQEEFRGAIKTSRELAAFLETNIPKQPYKVFIPTSFAYRIKEAGMNSALWKQFIPSTEENNTAGFHDPIGDKIHAKDNGIIHRYKNRILFSPTTICPINCRYCFRKNELEQQEDFLKANLNKLIEYLFNHPEVEEVILTGGDPLILSNKKLEEIFIYLSKVSTVKYIRLHSRTPVILPRRMDNDLYDLFKSYQDKFEAITLAIHTNHSTELTSNFFDKIAPFKDFNLISQSVLLKGVNNSTTELVDLFKALNKAGIRPYYLHHPDQVMGGGHFYLSQEEGALIYTALRNNLPGWMIPHYVVDSPMGTGKTLVV